MNDLKRLRKEHAKMGKTIDRLEGKRPRLRFINLFIGDEFVRVGSTCPSIKVDEAHEVYWTGTRLRYIPVESLGLVTVKNSD